MGDLNIGLFTCGAGDENCSSEIGSKERSSPRPASEDLKKELVCSYKSYSINRKENLENQKTLPTFRLVVLST